MIFVPYEIMIKTSGSENTKIVNFCYKFSMNKLQRSQIKCHPIRHSIHCRLIRIIEQHSTIALITIIPILPIRIKI